MRERKFEKSHIHFLQTETLSDDSVFPILHKRLSIQPLVFAYSRPMFAIFQDYYRLCGEERRRREMRMSRRCFTKFPISGLGKPKLYQNLVWITMCGDFTWRVVNMNLLLKNWQTIRQCWRFVLHHLDCCSNPTSPIAITKYPTSLSL